MYTGAEIIAISTWNILPRLFQKNSSRPLINIKIPQSTSHTVKIKFKHNSDLSSSIFFFGRPFIFSLHWFSLYTRQWHEQVTRTMEWNIHKFPFNNSWKRSNLKFKWNFQLNKTKCVSLLFEFISRLYLVYTFGSWNISIFIYLSIFIYRTNFSSTVTSSSIFSKIFAKL